MDFPGVVGNPLPLVRFRRKDRFSAPLVEKPPAPAAVRRFHCRRHFWVLPAFLLFFYFFQNRKEWAMDIHAPRVPLAILDIWLTYLV